jgi:hypothetical protein
MVFRILLFVYFISLFYNIPILSIGNEIKLFDPLFLYFIYAFITNKEGILFFSRMDKVSKGMFYFAIWCSFTFLISCVWLVTISKIQWIFISGLYLYHLWGFVICAIFFRKESLIDRKFFEFLVFSILVMGIIESLIIIGQNVGIVPYLWSDVYFAAYGETSLSGTLGPNRIVGGSTMFLMFMISLSVIVAKQSLVKSRYAAYVLAVLSMSTLLLSGSRTAYVTILVFLLVLLILSPYNVIKFLIPIIVILVIFQFSFNTSIIEKKIENMIDLRVIDELDNTSKFSTGGDYYDNLGSGRKGKSYRAALYIGNNPWILPFGSGFNNHFQGAAKEGNSPHNMYLTLILENGIVGLVLYISMIFGFLRGRLFDPQTYILAAAIIAISVNLFFGETFYIFRPCFALLGLLLICLSISDIKRLEIAFLDKSTK